MTTATRSAGVFAPVVLVGVSLALCLGPAAAARAGDKPKAKSPQAGAASPAPPAQPPLPPELKLLEPLAGTWDLHYTFKPSPNAEEVQGTGVAVAQWVLGGRFMQTSSASARGDSEAAIMMTYDASRGEFRRWFFHSVNGASEFRGRWDEKSQAFTWTGENPNGRTTTVTDRRIDDDHRGWSVVVKDGEGKTVGEMGGTSTRRKGGEKGTTATDAAPAAAPVSPGRKAPER